MHLSLIPSLTNPVVIAILFEVQFPSFEALSIHFFNLGSTFGRFKK